MIVTHIVSPGTGAGPVHAMDRDGYEAWQAVCGMRPRLRHNVTPSYGESITCAKCSRAIARGRAYARGRS